MRRINLRRVRAVAVLAAISALALAGASAPRRKRAEAPPPKVEESVGDLVFIASKTELKLEGVGLVVGLDDTGVDPPPSWYRTKLLDEMKKAGVERSNDLLKNPKVAMVIVRMTVPAGVSPSDRLDVEVELPPAAAIKKPGLAGGYLLQTRLRELMVLGGTPKEGQDAALAQGPVMLGTGTKPDDYRAGRVLGGGRVKKGIPYQLILKENRKSFRNASMVEGVVNQRFPQTEGVEQKGSAHAKTDQYLELKVPQVYHQNQDRFFRVVKLLPMVDTPDLRVQRTALWGKDLLAPQTAGPAALRLEGMGLNAAETLKTGLTHAHDQVRFLAAEALAYLNDPAGAPALAETVKKRHEFRAEALAALAAMDQPASHMTLRHLMDEPDVHVRYGAFNALRVLSPDDPFLGQVRVLDDPAEGKAEEAPSDNMSVAIGEGRRKTRVEDPFSLYLVDCDGPPMVHVSRSRRCEVVVFGRGIKLLPPVVLGTGAILLNASDGDDVIQISKIVPSKLSEADTKVNSSLELGDVLRRAANLGANYPEIVTILQAAQKQQNLPGPLVVDALPSQQPEYLRAAFLGEDVTAKKDDAVKTTKSESTTAKPKRRSLLDLLRGRPAEK